MNNIEEMVTVQESPKHSLLRAYEHDSGLQNPIGVADSHGFCICNCEGTEQLQEMLEIHDCPLCDGGALLEEETGGGYYVMCLECGCHSVTIDFHSEEERLDAAKRTVLLWNTGKVISSNPGE